MRATNLAWGGTSTVERGMSPFGEILSFGEGRLMKHAAHLRLTDEEEQARLAEERDAA